jgi:hypothetical protein
LTDPSADALEVLAAIQSLEVAGQLTGATQRQIRQHLGWPGTEVWAALSGLRRLGLIETAARNSVPHYCSTSPGSPDLEVERDYESILQQELNRSIF